MNEEQPICLFDMDGTLADYEGQLCFDLEKMRSPHEPKVTPKNIHNHQDDWIVERMRAIKRQPGWWLDLPRFDLGWDIFSIAKSYFSIHILTKGPSSNFDAWKEKGLWIRRHITGPVTIHMTEDKQVHYGRVLVDDYMEYCERWLQYRPRGLVIQPANEGNMNFDHPMGAKHPNIIRYDGTNIAEVNLALRAAANRHDGEHWRDTAVWKHG